MAKYVILLLMAIRTTPLIQGEYYHIYNRGVDKREIFSSQDDLNRFLESMHEFNNTESIGSLYERRRQKQKFSHRVAKQRRLVDIVAYCLNFNHYHLILIPLVKDGISKFMHKLGMGYTHFYNEKYERSGVLFQGRFKAIHIDSDEYLMHISAYTNLNDRIHKFSHPVAKLTKSSWDEYMGVKIIKDKNGDNVIVGNSGDICNKDIVLARFDHIKEYKKFAESSLEGILERRYEIDMINTLEL